MNSTPIPRPSVVVFDLGKVLVDFDYSVAARRIAARCRAPVDHSRFFAEHGALLRRYELGGIDTCQFYQEIQAACGFDGSHDEFGDYFADIFTPIPPMVELQGRLRQNGVPVYIFSNTNELAVRHIRHRFPFFSDFDGYVLSYEHGAMKPDARLYEVLERKAGRRKTDILYLDDLAENVAAGARRGWITILHETPEKTRTAVRELGLVD